MVLLVTSKSTASAVALGQPPACNAWWMRCIRSKGGRDCGIETSFFGTTGGLGNPTGKASGENSPEGRVRVSVTCGAGDLLTRCRFVTPHGQVASDAVCTAPRPAGEGRVEHLRKVKTLKGKG